MSYTTSAMLSRAQSSIAVAGATGRLGYIVTETLLMTFKPFFSRVVALTRDASSQKAHALAALGADVAEVRLDDQGPVDKAQLQNALKGIDVVVNVLGMTTAQLKDAVAAVAIEAGAKVYFPSEFGVDHRLNDFPGFDHEEWVKKQKHMAYANELAGRKGGDVKVIAVYTGLFLEDSISPRFGMDLDSRTFTTIGPASARTTFTSKADIARAVAQLAILAMVSPATLSDIVPSHVRIAGCTRSAEEIARALSSLRGSPGSESKIEIKEENLSAAREKLKADSAAGNVGAPAGYIRVLMGEGKLDFSGDNANGLVNPNERLWKWKSIEEAAKELLV